jgi:hypothetical protein
MLKQNDWEMGMKAKLMASWMETSSENHENRGTVSSGY